MRLILASLCLCLVNCGDGDGANSCGNTFADCEDSPDCRLDFGTKLDLEGRCVGEPRAVGCLGPTVLCDQSFSIGENALGELFRFTQWCGSSEVTFVDVGRVDHPLHSQLFAAEPIVWEWPTCSPRATCITDDDCSDGEYCDGDPPCGSPGVCEEIEALPCPLPIGADGTRDEDAEVCGCDGVTYQSECAARSSGTRIAAENQCT